MHFLSDAIAEIEGLLEVNRDFCKKQMAEKASPTLPTNCAVLPIIMQEAPAINSTIDTSFLLQKIKILGQSRTKKEQPKGRERGIIKR